MDTKVLWRPRDWVEAIAALPAEGPLPCRTVLVPNEPIAHVVRRELLRAGRADLLAGTRFLATARAAGEVLGAAGIKLAPGEEDLRAARLMAIFRSGVPLGHFPLELLRTRPGWDEAFAGAISDLEGAGLRSGDLDPAECPPPLRDVAAIWRALDESAGRSWTTQRLYLEAARVLEADAGRWPFEGAALAMASGHETAAWARFVRAIPRTTLALLGARPLRERYLRRVAALFGDAAVEALRSTGAPRASASERDLLVSFLFEPPSVLADPSRPRSEGPDGSVDLEEHAGVEEEVQATADWVVRQVAAGTALEDIAVLVPAIDPLAGLIAARLARIPWRGGALPVHVAGGLPLVGSAAGARALAVVRALRAHLSAEALAEILPALRASTPDGRPLGHGEATRLVWALGTVGGNSARPEGALEWSELAAAREAELEAELAAAREAEREAELAAAREAAREAEREAELAAAREAERGAELAAAREAALAAVPTVEESGRVASRRARDLERRLHDLRAVRPALDALVAVARLVLDDAPLSTVWPALREFWAEWLLQPGGGPRVEALLDERLGSLSSDATCGALAGEDALRRIEETVASARLPSGRFGEPAVYVGTVRDAVGLSFDAVRVVGLSEGRFPAVPREDPVLPDALRETIRAAGPGAVAPPTAADRVLEDLHALDLVLRGARRAVALSVARLDVERSQREPSSIFLEAAAALGRPNRATGERGATIPDGASLRRDGFVPSREAAAAFRARRPLGETAWLDGVSRRAFGVPSRWRGRRATDLGRLARLASSPGSGSMDGILGSPAADVAVPGLRPEHPISPSALEALLACPYAFLLGHVLGFDEPPSPPSQGEIGQPDYGHLLHAVAAAFYARHGAAFCARERDLEYWKALLDPQVERAFAAFVRAYPLAGEAVRAQQRERLRRDLHELVEYDWERAAAGQWFVAVERPFGEATGVALPLGDRRLFVRGRIDRLDLEGPTASGRKTLVRDFKTGRAHPRLGKEAEPDPGLDLQLAVYGLVAGLLAVEWGVSERVAAAYAYVGRGGVTERSFRDDFHAALEPAARRWLEAAAGLLEERLFPRTPNEEDCAFCAFRPVCGDRANERARALLSEATGALARFATLKGVRSEGGEED